MKKFGGVFMPSIKMSGKSYTVDDEGFLDSKHRWSHEWAEERAKQLDITLTEEHWRVIVYLRKYTNDYGIAPLVNMVCAELGIPLLRMLEMFGEMPLRNASRIAGLERPTGCI
jgi:TusE/DsrC/DsvC family sulfur relay protein